MNGFAGTSVRLTAQAMGSPTATLTRAVHAPKIREFLRAWTYRRRDRASWKWPSVSRPPSVTLATSNDINGRTTRTVRAIAATAIATCSARTGHRTIAGDAVATARLTTPPPDSLLPGAVSRRLPAGRQM